MNLDFIGQNIRRYRKQNRLSQEKLAEKTDLSVNYIGMLERNEKTPSLDTLIKIASTLGVPVEVLLTEECIQIQPSIDEKIKHLSLQGKQQVYDVVDAMLKYVK